MKRYVVWTVLLGGCSSGNVALAPDAYVADLKTLYDVALVATKGLEPRFRAQFRADLGAAYARAHNPAQGKAELETALEAANELKDPSDRDRVLTRVARGFIAVGDPTKAHEIAARIGGTEERGEVLGELAEDNAQALALPTVPDRDRALQRLAIQDANNGNMDRAGQTVRQISDQNLRPQVMAAITKAMLKSGRTIDAVRLVGSLDGLAKSEASAVLALDATAHGETRAALKWTKAIESELIKARTVAVQGTLQPVGSAQRKKLADEATKLALDVASTDFRSGCIEAVARTFADAGDPVLAAAVLDAGLTEPARNQKGKMALDAAGARRVRTVVASAWAATGAIDQATRQAELIDDTVMAAEAWGAVARAATARGNFEPAMAAAVRIVPDELRLPVLADVAVASPPEITASMRDAMTHAIVRDVSDKKR